MKVSVVVPTYNEKENVGVLIPRVFEVFKASKINGSVIVVDDNSPDGTAAEVRRLMKKYPISLIERDRKMGLGSAYIAGFKRALEQKADMVFEMDADLSHDPSAMPAFIAKANSGFDVVVGSRLVAGGRVVGWGMHRKAVSFFGNSIGRLIAGIGVSDLTSGYRVYKKDVLKGIELDKVESKSYDFQLEMLARSAKNDFKVGTVPIVFHDRIRGESKLSKFDMMKFLLTAIKIRLGLL
jgi:dolichol-phosphate mannosyltransferase